MTKTIDADGHVIEPADLWERELPASLKSRGFSVRWNADTRQEEVHVEDRCLLPFGIVGVGLAGRPFTDIGVGVRYSELHPGGFDPKRRLQDLDAERIDTAVIQVLCAFLRERAARNLAVTWRGTPQPLLDAARLLGVGTLLALPSQATEA